MQVTLLPKKTLLHIDRIQHNLLWGTTPHKHKLHLLNWDTITLPKQMGGLGIQKLYPKNIALLVSLSWRYYNTKSTIWTIILQGKYHFSRNANTHVLIAKSNDSYIWKSIFKGNHLCQQGTTWNIQ